MQFHSIRHNWPKNTGFIVDRPHGRREYTFVHYCTSVVLTCGEKTYETQPGACILVEPGVTYRLYAPEPLVHDWMHLQPEAKEWIEQYQIPVNEPFYPKRSKMISEKMRKMEAEFYSDEPYRETLLDNYLQSFWIWMHRMLHPTVSSVLVSHSMKSTLTDVRMQILSAPEKKWTLAEMAAMVPLSPSRFHAVYKTLFGTTPTKDLIYAKVHSARSLLVYHSEMSLKEISDRLGYNDQYHFIRQFKAVTGKTPGEYRKNKKTEGEIP